MSPTASEPRAVLNDMWQTRPTRRQSDRKIAGVAVALARRYDVDPVLIRIGFVVAAFCGVGILLYLTAWIALPPDFNDPPQGRMHSSPVTRVLVYVGLVLVSLHVLHRLAGGEPDFLVGSLVVGGLLYLLQVTRGEPRPDGVHAAAPAAAGDTAASASGSAGQVSGLGPSASGLTAPSAAAAPVVPPGQRAPRSRVTPVTIALALLAAGITGVVSLSGHVDLPGARAVIAVPLAVIGIGMLVGSFTRGGRGLILVALPLILVGIVGNWAHAQPWRGAGELRVAPASIGSIAPEYAQTFGEIEVDLRNVELAPAAPSPPTAAPAPSSTTTPSPPTGALTSPGRADAPAPSPVGEPIRTRVTVQFGEALVLVPPNADVRVHCHAAIGEVDCLGDQGNRYGASGDDGPTADAVVNSLGNDGVAGGRPLEIDVNVGTGSVEVRRG